MRFPDSIFPRFRMLPRFEFPPIPRFGAFPRFPDSMDPDSKQIPIKQPAIWQTLTWKEKPVHFMQASTT